MIQVDHFMATSNIESRQEIITKVGKSTMARLKSETQMVLVFTFKEAKQWLENYLDKEVTHEN